MAAGSWTFTNNALLRILNGGFDFDTDTFKVALLTSTSNISAASTTFAGLTGEVASGAGYTSGGESVTLTITGTTIKSVQFNTNPTWTASGGDITCRWAVLYEVGGDVVCYFLFDSTPADVTIEDGNPLTIDSDGTPPIFTLEQTEPV